MLRIACDDAGLEFSEILRAGDATDRVNARNGLDGRSSTWAIAQHVAAGQRRVGWVVDYWQSALANDAFAIQSLASPQHERFLLDALSGAQRNADLIHLICHFDYLRDSRAPSEQALGTALYEAVEAFARFAIEDGELAHVVRSRLEPMIDDDFHRIVADFAR